MQRLQRSMGLTYLFISHDLSVVRHVAQRTAVMYLGKLMEVADGPEVYVNPLHPYTAALLSAVPIADPKTEKRRSRILLGGDLPSPINIPRGCRFHTRCPLHAESAPASDEEIPELREYAAGHLVACHLVSGGNPAPRLAGNAADIVPAETG